MGTTISASANLTAPLGVIALDNDIEEVNETTLYTCSAVLVCIQTQSASGVLIKY